MNSKIYAVIVTYNPDINTLSESIKYLIGQVYRIIIVDNNSINFQELDFLSIKKGIILIKFSENKGIASAQNEGIRYANSHKAKYILLMDQDSIIPNELVSTLYKECHDLEIRGIRVGAVGCSYRDSQDDKINVAWKANGLKIKKIELDSKKSKIFAVDFVIASGSLIPISTLNKIGLMEEGLFIDLVDIEWGLRGKFYGYQSYQILTNIMIHKIGNGRQKIFCRNFIIHSPIRNYYYIRNRIFLIKRNYIELAWRLYFVRQIFQSIILFGIFQKQRLLRIKLIILAIKDGLIGRYGRFGS
ncbi:glycosyltransferase family 2 protein [Acidiphilium sp. PM]|uniref:glycosyltransferase family 2 protein n=1 Tax=Acidiphilium sp. PM TaxID=1043206 RepID=UPI000214566A|nr:glycosyltransferase family 2 protein [Acidiphilium sp. PM]EGO97009.1 Putative glycosyl transferase [Acidiphilium sp. PM]